MPGSPRPPSAPPTAPAPAGGGGEEQEDFEICNENGFVYKRPRGLYPDVATSSAQAVGPDPEVARLRRRRRALRRLRAKRLQELSRWEALASALLVPPPAPRSPPPQAPHASPLPAASAASASVLDDLVAQVEVQAELLKKVAQCCDEIDQLCNAHEAALADAIAVLPVWGNPKELMTSLCSPSASEQAVPGDLHFRKGYMFQHKQDEANAGFLSMDRRLGDGAIEAGNREVCKEAGGVSSALVYRKRKVIASPSGSNSVAAEIPNKSNRKKASGMKSSSSSIQASLNPGQTRRNASSTPTRALGTFCSPGPTTRRRAAAQTVSPGGPS